MLRLSAPPAVCSGDSETVTTRDRALRLAALLCAAPALVSAQQLTEPVASYRIEVRLDDETKLLHGTETLTWRNGASVPVGDLWFHLYQNAFLNEASTQMRERGRFSAAVFEEDPAGIGYTDVHSIELEDGTDLLSTLRWRQLDDDNADDRTVFSVDLPEPLAPGDEVTLRIEFTTKLPREVGARSERVDDYYLVGQWFPKIAVFEDLGVRGTTEPDWNAHQFHAETEFYSDFGRYDVAITVPEGFVVGATGSRTDTRTGDGTVTYVYQQDDVHDFAWTAWPRFQEVVDTFDPDAEITLEEIDRVAQLLGVDAEALRLRPVEITLLIPPGFAHHTDRVMTAVKNGLKWFGLWYGPYPYDTVTVVVPADGTTGSGMEYPTFFTGLDAQPLRVWPVSNLLLIEEVVIHEFGHQYWYGMIASNEFEEAWLDEGFNSYSTGKVMQASYGRGAGRLLGIELDTVNIARSQYLVSARAGRVRQDAWTYELGGYGVNSYPKPELALTTLERYLGAGTFARAMREYFQRWKFRHPTSTDFFAVVEEACGCDLSSFWEQMIFGDAVADYAIASAASTRVRGLRGRFLRDGEWVIDTAGGAGPESSGDSGADDTSDVSGEPDALYRTRVVAQRLEDFRWPVDVLLRFRDGSEIVETWDGQDRTFVVEHTGPSRLAHAVVDPEHALALDINWLNNSRVLVDDAAPRERLTRRFFFWMANLLLTASGVG